MGVEMSKLGRVDGILAEITFSLEWKQALFLSQHC